MTASAALRALALAGLRVPQALLALAWGLGHALARHYAPGQPPADNFMVLVHKAGDRPRAVFWHDLAPGMTPVTQPMHLPAGHGGGRAARLQATGPHTWQLWVDLETAQLTQRYRVQGGRIEPLYLRSDNIATALAGGVLAFPAWALGRLLLRRAWRRWRHQKEHEKAMKEFCHA